MNETASKSAVPGIHALELDTFLELLLSRRRLAHHGVRDDRRVSAFPRSVRDRETGEVFVLRAPTLAEPWLRPAATDRD